MEINETYDLFCVDCGKGTKQIYKGRYVDGSHLYIYIYIYIYLSGMWM